MAIKKLVLLVVPLLALTALVPLTATAGSAHHVRWDIISLVGGAPPGPLNPGGHASAMAPDGDMITLTGSGTFVAPAGHNGGSDAVTGGGTWQTNTASGTYVVKELVSWVKANAQTSTPTFIDNIGSLSQRTNGTAVLRIQFSDGASGVLTVGCHGPGAPPGIIEGIATTKGFKTYYGTEEPVGGIDANRTLFHVR
jgi:hypothetical protein